MHASNLPASLTRLVGREHELAELRELLAQARLLTLVGAGGVGKTRLALELARRVEPRYADGVTLVQVAALTEPSPLAQIVATAAGILERPDRSFVEQLAYTWRGRRLLLVLDNCEHLLEACAELADTLLAACPGLSILVTSRERLGLTGEITWRVPSLPFPWPQRPPPVDRLAEYPAVQLFLERASEARPGVVLASAADAAAVAAICFRLDGIPLALELAAARLPVLSLAELAARLDDRFRLLAGGRHGGPPRHQTLRASLDWSHDLLSPSERMLFRRLSVFAGGWSLEAATHLMSEDALDLLAQLVDKSLVQASAQGSGMRYTFLEIVKAYASERLTESGEAELMRGGHAEYYLSLAEAAQTGIRGPDQRQWIQRLEVEHDNLRAAAGWFGQNSNRARLGLRLAAALWEFWQIRGYLGEGTRRLEAALEADPDPSVKKADALSGLGVMASVCGDYSRGERLFLESAELFATHNDHLGHAYAMSYRAVFRGGRGDLEAVLLGRNAVSLARATGNRHAQALALHALGVACAGVGDSLQGLRSIAEAARLCCEIGEQRGLAYVLLLFAGFHLSAGAAEEALASVRKAITIFMGNDDRWGMLLALAYLVAVQAELGGVEQAAQLFAVSQTLRERIGAELAPPHQHLLDRGAARARERLGEAAFQAAVSTGQSLPLDGALINTLVGPVEAAGSPRQPTATPNTKGTRGLTLREREVVALIAQGLTNRQIADQLVIAERTADTHVQNILSKLGCRARSEVAALIATDVGT